MNIKKLKALSRVTCEATVNLSNAYKAAKEFVDAYEREQRHVAQERKWSSEKQRAYGKLLDCAIGRMSRETICNAAIELAQACKPEREEHEQRHDSQAVPVNWSVEKDNAYHALTEAIFERKPLSTIQKAAITFVDICNREEREKKPKLDRAWSPEKHQAYHRLLDDFIGHKHYDEIVADARRLAAVCEREERAKPETGDVYRDIFGNTYAVIGVHDSFPDGEPVKKPFVMLIYSNAKGELSSSKFFTVPLEDFMNPTFKKV